MLFRKRLDFIAPRNWRLDLLHRTLRDDLLLKRPVEQSLQSLAIRVKRPRLIHRGFMRIPPTSTRRSGRSDVSQETADLLRAYKLVIILTEPPEEFIQDVAF